VRHVLSDIIKAGIIGLLSLLIGGTLLALQPPPKPTTFQEVEADAVNQAIAAKTPIIIDARSASSYKDGHIPSAINLPFEGWETAYPGVEASIKGKPLLIYCSGYSCEDSKNLAKVLAAKGYPITLYTRGWEEWEAGGFPFEK